MTFRDVRKTPDLENLAQEHLSRLERRAGTSLRAELAVERPHRSHKKLRPFRVRLTIFGAGEPVVVRREKSDIRLPALMATCFDVADRILRERRGDATRPRRSAA